MKKTARQVNPSTAIETTYRRRLNTLIKSMSNSVTYWLEASYKANTPDMAQDALPSAELSKRLKELSSRWIERFDDMSLKISKSFAESGQRYTDNSFRSALKDAGWTVEFKMTPSVKDAVNATVQANVSLIKSIPEQYFTQVEGIVMRGFQTGRDLGAISKDLEERYGVTKRRAAFIARDQNDKLTAALTQARRQELGITEAIWVHSGAGKHPRPSHVRAGKDKLVFNVSEGALIDGKMILPGEEPGCRCTSKSVLPF